MLQYPAMLQRSSRIILFLGFLLAFQNAVAQTEPATTPVTDSVAAVPVDPTLYPKFTYGVRGGVNFSQFNINGGDYLLARELRDDRANHVRVQTGLVANYALNQSLSLQAELLFSQKGMKYRGATPVNKILEEYKDQTILNYLELPVLFKVSSPVYGDSLKFFVNVGPSVSFMLNGKERIYTEKSEIRDKVDFNYAGGPTKYKRLDASIHAGAGFELLTKVGNIAVEGRGVLGLMNIVEADTAVYPDFPKVYNRSIGLYITYFLQDLGRN